MKQNNPIHTVYYYDKEKTRKSYKVWINGEQYSKEEYLKLSSPTDRIKALLNE